MCDGAVSAAGEVMLLFYSINKMVTGTNLLIRVVCILLYLYIYPRFRHDTLCELVSPVFLKI